MELIRSIPIGGHGDDGGVESVTADTDTAGSCGFSAHQHQQQQQQQQQKQKKKQQQQLAEEMAIADASALSSSPTTTITATTIAAAATTSTAATAATITSPRLPSKPHHVDIETRELHAAVAAGNVAAVEAYIERNAGNKASGASGHGVGEVPVVVLSGLGALLASSGLGPEATTGSSLEVRDRRGRTPLLTACVCGQAGLVRTLLRAGANANAFDSAGYSALHRCAQSCDVDSARALLAPRGTASAAADVDAPTRRGDYRPLHLACLAGSADMVGLLTRRRAEVSASDKWGCTPLHRACLEGHLGAAKAVLDAGAVVDGRDKWKCTPLHRACNAGHTAIVDLLLRRGASPSAKDDVMERPGQSFENDVSSERRETIGALLKKKLEESRSFSSCGGGGGGGGGDGRGKGRAEGSSPASASTVWSRPKADPNSAGPPPKRNPNRYVPPAARARALLESSKASAGADGGNTATAAATAITTTAGPTTAATVTATAIATATTSATAAVTTGSRRAVQPWRRSSARTAGLTGERGPDVDESGLAVENACGAGGSGVGVGVGAILRAGRRNATEAPPPPPPPPPPPEKEEAVGASSGVGVRAAVCCSPTGGIEEPDGGFDGFGDLHTDVFALGDDWGMLSFDGAPQQPHYLGAGGAD